MTQVVTGEVKWTLPCTRCGLVVTEANWFPGNPQKHYDTFTCIRLLRAELQAYKDDPTKALQEIGYHDVEQFYKSDGE